jgi:hypothetical protein
MPQPTERDIMVVQEKLAELYARLTPAQQEVLDTIMAAGLSFIDEDDTGGFSYSTELMAMELHTRERMSHLQDEWRRANPPDDSGEDDHQLRWNLKPLLDWFNRPQPRPA